MNRVEELIEKLCPDGVEYKTLGEIGKFYGGLSGKTKEDFGGAGLHFITYMNVYSNISVNTNITDTVRLTANEKQNVVQYGDVLFTGSSETKDECGISSVMTYHTAEPIYLNSFCFGFRLDNLQILNPEFAKYLFRSESIRKQIIKTASGVTRFNVSKKKMGHVSIPLPPIEVQNEIVNILDNFSKLEAELEAELEARKQQYEYYCLSIIQSIKTAQQIRVKDLGEWSGGKTPSTANQNFWENGRIPWVSSKDMKSATLLKTENMITEDAVKNTSIKIYPKNTIAVVVRSGILKRTLPVAYIPFETTVNQDIKILVPKSTVHPRYAYNVLYAYSKEILAKAKKRGGTVDSLDVSKFMNFEIPLPPLEEQTRIVSILDRFDKLCNDLTEGLPAEIEARRKQYEYYRDLLLTFKPKEGREKEVQSATHQ